MLELQNLVNEKRAEIVGLLSSFRQERMVQRLNGEASERVAIGEGTMRNLQDMVMRKKKTYGNDKALFLFEVRCIDVNDLVRRAAISVAMEHIKFSRSDLRLDLCRTLELSLMDQDLAFLSVGGLVDHVEELYTALEKNPNYLATDPGFSDEFLDIGSLSTEPYGGFD